MRKANLSIIKNVIKYSGSPYLVWGVGGTEHVICLRICSIGDEGWSISSLGVECKDVCGTQQGHESMCGT